MTDKAEYRNIQGRRGGRGFRPMLLVIKHGCLAMFVGGLISLLVLVFMQPEPTSLAGWQTGADFVQRAYRFVIVPGLCGAMLVGLLLLSSFWRVALRMRWFVVKAVLVAVAFPGLHVFMHSRSTNLQELLSQQSPDLHVAASLWSQLLVGTAAATIFAFAIIILGRTKPRLGQDYGRTFSK